MAKSAIYLFAGFMAIALIGFWPTYFQHPDQVPTVALVHGIVSPKHSGRCR